MYTLLKKESESEQNNNNFELGHNHQTNKQPSEHIKYNTLSRNKIKKNVNENHDNT